MSTMKALVLREYDRLEIADVERPVCKDDDVLIRVSAAGICGSDVHGLDGSTGRRIPPLIMGHEASGVIAEVGSAVSGWTMGDRVTFDSTVYCGICSYCAEGRVNLCNNRQVIGVSCSEFRRDGAFAEYIAVPGRILYRIPDGVTDNQAAMVEALSVALHGVERGGIRLGDSAAVVGAGMIGLLLVQLLKAAGCRLILVFDIDEGRLRLARGAGATDTMNSQSEWKAPYETDIAFDAVGIQASVETAVKTLKKGGRLTLIGNIASEVKIPLQHIVTREITLLSSCASAGEYPRCLELLSSGSVNLDPLMSAAIGLDEAPEYFRRLRSGDGGLFKVLIRPQGAVV